MSIFKSTDKQVWDAFSINLEGTQHCIDAQKSQKINMHTLCDIASRISEQRHLIQKMVQRRRGLATHMRIRSNRVRMQLLELAQNAELDVSHVVACCAGHRRQSLLGFLYKTHKKGDSLEKRYNAM